MAPNADWFTQLAILGRVVTIIAFVSGALIMAVVRPRNQHEWSCLALFVAVACLALNRLLVTTRGVAIDDAVVAVMWTATALAGLFFLVASWGRYLRTAWRCRRADADPERCGS
jgi:hypothetical protein